MNDATTITVTNTATSIIQFSPLGEPYFPEKGVPVVFHSCARINVAGRTQKFGTRPLTSMPGAVQSVKFAHGPEG